MIGAIIGDIAEARFAIPVDMAVKAKSYLPQEMLNAVSKFEAEMKTHL